MTETPPPGPGPATSPPELSTGGGWKIIVPFFVLPLGIVLAAVAVFLLFGKLAERHSSPTDYLKDLRSESSQRRWQSAYELSRFLSRPGADIDRAKFEADLLEVLELTQADEVMLRRYLLTALGQVGGASSTDILLKKLRSDTDSETQIYAILALGRIGDPRSADPIAGLTASDDPGIRKTAAFALGSVGNSTHVPRLKALLEDTEKDVRWNAALGLAQLGDSSGQVEILNLLDPDYVRKEASSLRDPERNQILMSGINAAGRLKLKAAEGRLQELSTRGPDASLRSAATTALASIRN